MKRNLLKIAVLTLLICSFQMALVAAPDPPTPPQRGVAYGNVLRPGWSAFYQWVKGAYGKTSYRRVISQIRITPNAATVIFTNNASRSFYNMAIINNVSQTPGTLRNWKLARRSRFDTILLKNGKMIHPIIRGYQNGRYYFKGRMAPLHRKHIHIVYPNPRIPLRARL